MNKPEPIQDSSDDETISTFIDIAAGLFLAAVAIGTLAWLVPYHTKALSAENDIAPGFFPSVTAWIVLGLSVILVAVTAFRKRVAAAGLSGYAIIVEIVVWGGHCRAHYAWLIDHRLPVHRASSNFHKHDICGLP